MPTDDPDALEDYRQVIDNETSLTYNEADVQYYGTIEIDGYGYPILLPFSTQAVGIFQGKQTIGDYSKGSNPLQSEWVISDLSGGSGVDKLNVVSDVNLYKLGNLYTRFPNQISKGFRVHEVAGGDGFFDLAGGGLTIDNLPGRFLGDMYMDDDTVMAVGSLSDQLYDIGTGDHLGDLTEVPVWGVADTYRGLNTVTSMVIPLGPNGYGQFDSDGTVTVEAPDATHPAVYACLTVGTVMLAVDDEGVIWKTVNLSSGWSPFSTATALIPRSREPRCMVKFFDRSNGAFAPYITTDQDLWQFDQSGPSVYPIDVDFPSHPDHGRSAARHDGDMFIGVGMAIHRYTNGSWLSMGLDRRDGLPIEYQGAINNLLHGYRGMFAGVGQSLMPEERAWIKPENQKEFRSSVHEYTGAGWHMWWSDEVDLVANSVGVSQGRNDDDRWYRLYWFATVEDDFRMYYIDLPRSYGTPKERANLAGSFAKNGWLETGWFDKGMEGYLACQSSLKIKAQGLSSTTKLKIWYKVEDDRNEWQLLGTVSSSGTSVLLFGDTFQGVPRGVVFERVKLYVELESDDYDGAYIENMVLAFQKLVAPSQAFNFTIDLRMQDVFEPGVLRAHLRNVINKGYFSSLIVDETSQPYRVRLSQESESVWDSNSFIIKISALEIPNESSSIN